MSVNSLTFIALLVHILVIKATNDITLVLLCSLHASGSIGKKEISNEILLLNFEFLTNDPCFNLYPIGVGIEISVHSLWKI
jgi:hypothetical protein